MKNAVTWFELGAAPGTGPAMKEFYAQTFGWTYNEGPDGDYSMVGDSEGPGIGGGLFEDPEGPSQIVCIEVDDIHGFLARVMANGGTVVQEPIVIPGMVVYGKFRDPGGNVVGIVDSNIPDAESE